MYAIYGVICVALCAAVVKKQIPVTVLTPFPFPAVKQFVSLMKVHFHISFATHLSIIVTVSTSSVTGRFLPSFHGYNPRS